MKNLLKFDLAYFIAAIILLAVEICIALFLDDNIIRPYIGDLLVVILIYCTVKTFLNTPVLPTAIAVLLFAFLIEALQYFNVVKLLGWQHSSFARTIIGTAFSWMDVFCYVAGILVVLIAERYHRHRKTKIA